MWTYDILFDRLADGRPFKTLSILDEFTRECLAILVSTSIRAEDVISLLTTVIAECRVPVFIRSDNGSEFTIQSVKTFGSVILDKGLKDWVQASRKGWQAVHKVPGFAFVHRSGA